MATVTIKAVMDFFNENHKQPLKDFTAEWKQLTDEDKEQLKQGIADGTLTY